MKPSVKDRHAYLWANLFLVVTTYYLLKPARSALYLTEFGADRLPYIWIASALITLFVALVYGQLMSRVAHTRATLRMLGAFMGLLLGVSYLLYAHIPGRSVALFLWLDLYSIVLLEHYWGYAGDLFSKKKAQDYYSSLAVAGALGGLTGSLLSTFLVRWVGFGSLLWTAGAILIFQTTLQTRWLQFKLPDFVVPSPPTFEKSVQIFFKHRYFSLLFVCAVLAQLMSSLVDFSFNRMVETAYVDLVSRTEFLSLLFVGMTLLSLAWIFASPSIRRAFGSWGGFALLPVTHLVLFSLALFFPVPAIFVAMKLTDKSLNITLFRTQKEMLYRPADRSLKYSAKAAIDMFGFRLGKILGAVLILPVAGSWLAISTTELGILFGGLLFAVVCLLNVRSHRETSDALAV